MRIISLAPSNTEILYAIGAEDDIVAVTHSCDFPPGAKKKQKIGTWINTDPEKLKEYKPDLIFTSYFLPEPLKSWNGPGRIVHVAPKTLDDVFESFIIIGEAIGKKSTAVKLVLKMKQQLEKIQKNTVKVRPRVYMEEWHEPPFISGNWVPELVEIAGGIEGLVQKGEPSRVFKFEELQTFDPDIIICHWCGFGNRSGVNRVMNRKGWD